MSEDQISNLTAAIDALEAQRSILGDQVVDSALGPLREKLAALQSASRGEQRKIITILFADLVGFTALSAQMDPEEVHAVLNEYFAAWKACIEAHGGVVEKFIGDAVMAAFGLPVAHEDDPEQAVRAALDMRQRLEQLNHAFERRWGVRLEMRVGINTGEVVVSTLGERRGEAFVAVGETVNLASRIQAVAPSQGILITHDTYHHVSGMFDLDPIEPVRLKGVPGPVQAYRVHRAKPRAFRMRTRGLEGIETPVVGREKELNRLQEIYREVLEKGKLQAAILLGEAGIGKSRLLFEFDRWLEARGEQFSCFKGRAFASTQNSPYALMRDTFAFSLQIKDSDPPQLVREKLEQGLGETLGSEETGRLKAHFIGRLLGFEFGDIEHLSGALKDLKQFHERALIYLAEYFLALAQAGLVVVLLEDLHWADDASLELIERLESSLARQRLLLISAARPAFLERKPGWGGALPFLSLVNLGPLSEQASRKLVSEILRKTETVPVELRDLVVRNAEGNPFYIEELIKMLIEDGVIVTGKERWRILPERLAQVRVPPTLAGVLQARLDSLNLAERLVLQRAAVVGRVFWDQAVEFLMTAPSGYPAEKMNSSAEKGLPFTLAGLSAREMIFRQAKSSFEATQEYLFKHALMRDVTYESLLKRQRRMYHTYTARWLEQMTEQNRRADEYAGMIARHFDQGAEAGKAAQWYRRAGERAAAQFANAEAAQFFTKSLERTPESQENTRYELLLAREKVYERQGERQVQSADLEALTHLAEKLADPARQAEVLLRQANFAFLAGDYPAAISTAQKAIPLARVSKNIESEIAGYLWWGKSLAWQGEHAAASAQLEQALSLARANRLPNLEAECLWNLAIVALNQSQFAPAHDLLQQSLRVYRALGDREGEGAALGQLGAVLLNEGDYAGAEEYTRQALRLYRLTGHRLREGIMFNNLGVIAYEQGDYAEALRLHSQSLEISRAIGDDIGLGNSLGNLGDIAREVGNFTEARAYYEQALQLARQRDNFLNENLTLANLSLLFLQLGDLQAAIQAGREALDLLQSHDYPLYEVYTLTRLAHALLESGDLEESAALYQKALDLHLGMDLDHRSIDEEAGLASIALKRGDVTDAAFRVEAILSHLETTGLGGAEEPAHIYLTCYQVLQAAQDPRALPFLKKAYRFVQSRAEKIQDEALRRSFLENVPANRALVRAWEER